MRTHVIPTELIDKLIAEIDATEAAEAARKAGAASAAKPDPKQTGRARPGSRSRPGTDNRVARCRAYLNKVPGGVEGAHGSTPTFKAARIIWNDFAIDEPDGWPLLVEWNQSCSPPWPLESDEGGKQCLRRKWTEAVGWGPCSKGRGWRLKIARDEHQPPPVDEADGGNPPTTPRRPAPAGGLLPEIVHNERQYRDVEYDAARALVAANDPPWVFVGNGGGLVNLHTPDPDGPPRARELDGAAMRPVFARVADWYRVTHGEDGDRLVPDYPPPPLLASFPARTDWPGIPNLRSVVTYPVFAPGWDLLSTSGYHAGSMLYCHLGNLDVPPVPDRPTPEELSAAKELILAELLGDFPFVDQASRANAVAMLVLPLVRHTIDAPTPLAVLDAPAEGTGKSLLGEACMLLTLGEIPEAMTADLKEEERDKTLTALLLEGQPIIFFDNANKKLDSASFANTLTARRKRGRILGETRTASALVNVCWVLTGNNFTCSREIARRLYWSRLDAGIETPSQRSGWRHPDLLEWVRENRPRLIWALLVIVRHWIATGATPGTVTMGKFERWSRTVGGILAAAGIDGFLGNAERFRKQCADEVGETKEFVKQWADRLGENKPRIVAELLEIAKETLDSVFTAQGDDGKRVQLGKWLKGQRDRVVGQHRIVIPTKDDGTDDKDYAGRLRYVLLSLRKPTVASAGTPPADDSEFELSSG